MRAGTLTCPTCGGGSLEDRTTGERVPRLVRLDPGTRRPIGSLVVATGVLVFAVGLFFALLGFITELGWFALVLAVVWGLVLARLGVWIVRQGTEGLSREPTSLACLTCRTTWHAGQLPTTGPPTGAGADDAFDAPAATGDPTPAAAVIPRQKQPDARDRVMGLGGAHAPDIDEWVSTILHSLQREPVDAAESAALEQARIDTVRIIAQSGHRERTSGRGDGRAALDALVRLLDVDTGHLPELKVGQVRRTMRHEVIDQLGRSGDPAAIEPLIRVLEQERAHHAVAVQETAGTLPGSAETPPLEHPLRHSALAEDLYRAAVEALGRLGDPRALPALQEAATTVQLGMRSATSDAIHAIVARQPR